MSRTKRWEVSDGLWERVEPLLPKEAQRDAGKQYKRRPGAGRPGVDKRKVFEAIVRVLRTGCQWNSITKGRDGVGSSSVHRYFQAWTKAGVFLELWRKGLAEYDEMEGIAWEWQSIDATQLKAPLAQEAVGPNPTDRGKNGTKINALTEGGGVPLSVFITGANVHESTTVSQLIGAKVLHQQPDGEEMDENLCADNAYTGRADLIRALGYIPHICPRRQEAEALKHQPGFKARRWVVERFFSWLKRSRKILVRYEKSLLSYWGLVCLACSLISLQRSDII
ncbi:IS5 family transposase [Geminisphaera colitermitum]|uniref:IS5 family transposase n=1 Tax=Geminisphaera colitermitum TaxID=1148786 RepID=UPI000B496D07